MFELPDRWRWRTVKEIAAPEKYSCVGGPFGSKLSRKHYVESPGVPVIRGQNLGDGDTYFKDHDFVFVSEDKARTLVQNMAHPGDLVFTQRGTLGQVGWIPEAARFDSYVVSQSQMKLTINPEAADPGFIYSYFRSRWALGYIDRNAITTGVPHINLTILRGFPVPVPPLDEQRRIAAVLGALDDKIELNRKMNRTLEDIAQAIFKSWFIDFDGVPDSEMVESELGPIPKGWRVVPLSGVSESLNAKRIPVSKLERAKRKGRYPYYGASGIVDHIDSYLFEGNHLLVSEDGENLRTRKTPIAFIATGRFWVNNHAHVLLGRGGVSIEHLDLFFRRLDLHPFLTGAVQPKLSKRNLSRIPFLLPTPGPLEQFNAAVGTLFTSVRSNRQQSATLAALRDALLPKLISGEIRVPEAEEAVEAVV